MKKLNVKCYYKNAVKLVWSKQVSCAVLNDHHITNKILRGRRKLLPLISFGAVIQKKGFFLTSLLKI